MNQLHDSKFIDDNVNKLMFRTEYDNRAKLSDFIRRLRTICERSKNLRYITQSIVKKLD